MHLMTDGVTRAYVDGNGKVGIGTDSPDKKFVVSESGAHGFEISPYDGNQNATRLINYNRSTNAYFPLEIEASQITFETNGSEKARITPEGYLKTPNQPTFSIFGDTNPNWTSDVIYIGHTGSGAAAFDTNIGNHFSYTTGKFTAPVAGSYFFSFRATTGDTNSHFIDIYKNGTRVGGHTLSYGYSYLTATNTAVLTLASGDYIEARRRAAGYSLYSVNFSGFLIG